MPTSHHPPDKDCRTVMKQPAAYRRLAAMGSPADHGSASMESPTIRETATTTTLADPTQLEISVDKGRAAELKMVTLMKPYHHDTCILKYQLTFLSKTLSQMCSVIEPRHTAKGKLMWAKKDQLLKVRERLVDLTEARTKGMQAKSVSDMPAVQELMMLTAGKVKGYLAVSRQGMMREIKKGLTPEVRDQIQWKDFGALATEKWDNLTTQIEHVVQQIEANKQQLDRDMKAVVEVFGLLEVKSEPGGLYPEECDTKPAVQPYLDAITVDDHLDRIEKLIFGIDLTSKPEEAKT